VKRNISVAFAAIILIVIMLGVIVVVNPPAAHQVIIKSYESNDATLQALRSGKVDLAVIENAAPPILTQLKTDTSLNVVSLPSFGFTYIGMNLRNSPLDNLTFRKAMLYGFDREDVLRNVLDGYGEILNAGLFSSAYAGLGWRNGSVDAYPYNPGKAGRLLDVLGYTATSGGVRVDPSTGQQLRTMFIFSRLTDPEGVAVADLFAKDMRAIGLPVISFPLTDVDFNLDTKITYYFDMYVDTVSSGPAPTWLNDLFAGSNNIYPAPLATNLDGYNNRTFDASVNELMTATDSSVARNAAYRCQEQLGVDLPALPVYSGDLLIVTRPNFAQLVPVAGSVENTLAQSLAEITSGTTVVGETLGLSSLNPSLALSPADLLTLRLVTEPLFESDGKGILLPGLASDWRLTDNATKLSIILRQGVSFSDGSPITSHDVAATIEWLMKNAIPSSPLYSTINKTRSVAEVDSRTVEVTLLQPDSLAANEFANLFALPASLLPTTNTPLGLLKAGGLVSSGPFTLARFVQGREADLVYNPLLPGGAWGSPGLANINGADGQELLGTVAGGSQIHLLSQPLNYQGQQIENATLTTQIYNSSGEYEATNQGSYLGFGVYTSTVNLNTQALPAGSYEFSTQLYAELPSGAIIQFGGGSVTVHPPLLLLQFLIYIAALAAVLGVAFRPRRVVPKRRVKRVPKRRKRARVSRPRRRK
jgi:ABC-type transport system substrate-binding protein